MYVEKKQVGGADLTQDFGKNEDEDHANEKSGLLRCAADTGVTDNTNGEAIHGLAVICESAGEGQ